jgi:hypothetical protein
MNFKPTLSPPSHPVVLILIGLLIAQILATIQVYLSNLDLYKSVSAVNAAGYLAIPNQKVMAGLHDFKPAFFGGLFFTLTIGAGITLGTMAAAWVWIRIFLKSKSILLFFLFAWGILILLVNIHGFSPIPSLYFLLIPPVMFMLTARRESHAEIPSGRIRRLIHLIPIVLLALLWLTQFDRAMFLDLRDNLLLSNPLGRKFSHFYYTYTLYPAEVFKALDQKSIKTCSLENIGDRAVGQKLANRLMAYGYLVLPDTEKADLKIVQEEENLVLRADKRVILQLPVSRFVSESNEILHQFSERLDRNKSFRQFTFLTLVFGFPVLIYMLMHAALYYLLFLFPGRKTAALTASMMCLLIGIIVFFYFQSNRSGNIDIQNIAQALESQEWQTRVAALKVIQQKKLEIADYQAYRRVLKSPIPQERYWLVRTLAFSRRADTYRDLLGFLNDENTNVQTMAYFSLGQRKNRRAIEPILEKIKVSNNWYVQLYAFNALRTLGWKQTKSP